MSEYSTLDRILHSLALNFDAVKSMSYDLERSLAHTKAGNTAQEKHVFVTGLARAGTSILLRTLFQTKDFASQTYRDMPFVLAPQLWKKISQGWWRTSEQKERAHADGLMVDFDTVEAFEEVFWLTFAGDLYIRDNHLVEHSVDENLAALFRDFVAVVIASQGPNGPTRYLSKNNNNILRLAGLAKALPSGCIIVPFRSPLAQAQSLLRQHQSFSKAQNEDPFMKKYMRWLGHFEFGGDYRPFTFGDDIEQLKYMDASNPNHWLERWTKVYQNVLGTMPDNAILWDHEAFCSNPSHKITELGDYLNLDGDLLKAAVSEVRPSPVRSEDNSLDSTTVEKAHEVYAEMRLRAGRKL